MDSILEGLNAAQHAAVSSPCNVLQVLAPPGSGKTKTLTARVAYSLQNFGYKPWNIICLTFTIKSSREMKERISKLVGNGIERKLILGTFHSVCRRYLVTYGHLIGINKGFGIADSSDTISIIRRIIKRLGLNVDAKKTQSRISSSKSKGVGHVELAQEQRKQKNVEQQEFITVFEAYEAHLHKSNLLDYDDLLLRCVELLRRHPECVSNVEAVLIDEFQDTNIVQFDLMRLFAAKNQRITTVGDPDQSIYGWRSAETKNLKRMQKQYPDTLVFHLEDNYRSSGAILLAAREVIEQDESRPSKPLNPTHCPGTIPALRRLPSANIEASWIVSEIQRTVGLTGHLLDFSDFAILLRSASLSRLVESAMGKAGIPYRMVGGHRFFDRVEIKILLDYLRVISQLNNNDALVRVMNVPPRGLGAATTKSLLDEAESKKITLWRLIRDVLHGNSVTQIKLSKAAEQGLGPFTNIIITARNKMLDPINPPSPEALLSHIIRRLGFQGFLQKTHADDHEARWANVEELVAQASEYSMSTHEGFPGEDEDDALPCIKGLEQVQSNAAEEALSNFLANVALATELQRNEDVEGSRPTAQVTISTIHAAKGLEWPVVFVPSAYEGCIPHSRAEDTDEERRLLYVAMTRAQALLYVSCPTMNSQREETKLSPFLSPKNVRHFLTHSGPPFSTSTVADIASILGRDCPTESEIFSASESLQSLHDDLWPLTGEESVEAIQARWSKWDRNESVDPTKHVSKRRRVLDGEFVQDGHNQRVNKFITSSVGSTTTMQDTSLLTYPGNGGFTTAALQLKHVRQEKTEFQKYDASVKKLDGKSDGLKERCAGSNVAKSTKRLGSQGNIMSLWGLKDKVDTESCKPFMPSTYVNKKESKRGSSDLDALQEIKPPTDQKYGESHASTSRRPLSAIPQALAAHRLQPLVETTRPLRLIFENDPAPKQYPFLSSSPPPPERMIEEAEAGTHRPSQEEAVSSLKEVTDPHVSTRVTRPAATFHATSVTQLQKSTMSKKALGVRRSMNGWADRANPGFSVPKMAGGKPG